VTVAVSPDGAVEVADRGPGVAAEDRERIFERFWRGRAAARGEGAGLGLAIVAQIVAAHGGTITVGNPPGGGALFTLRLRVMDREANARTARETSADA
jgi:signal transduction histidine kinase